MNIADIIVISVIAVLAAAAIAVFLINGKKGKRCSCGCENCAYKCKNKEESTAVNPETDLQK